MLGSCVTACIRDRDKGLGGMNHLLPDSSEGVCSSSARYGAYAMEVLLNHLLKWGPSFQPGGQGPWRREGAGQPQPGPGGEKNAQFVLDYPAPSAYPWWPRTCSTSIRARSISFRQRQVMMKTGSRENDTLIEREREYQARLHATMQGDVELFG